MSHSPHLSSLNTRLNELLPFNGDGKHLLPQLKAYLDCLDQHLTHQFKQGAKVRDLVRARAKSIDKMLIALWRQLALADQPVTNQADNPLVLIAVGGYGRGELHPHSDIDLLVLSQIALSRSQASKLEQFVSLLWDCHLKVGQAVRTLKQCVKLASEDLTITTNLMEARRLVGNEPLFNKLQLQIAPTKIWDAKSFFQAKIAEQKARYRKYDGTSFDLEPNIKSSPGGLRDIHLTGWVAQRLYYPKTLPDLVRQNIITKKEYYTLMKAQLYLWSLRFALHLVSGKAEDRLLFDYQKSTANMMGFKDSKNSLAVEKMMKRYYRSVLIIRNISDILLQVLEAKLEEGEQNSNAISLDDNFQIINQRVDAKDTRCFTKNPSLLLKVFQYVAVDNSLKGITAQTLRAIRAARYKITASFRNNKNNKKLFIDFWHILHTNSRAIFLMKRNGILADYLTPFKQITGQMQYDMFHNYTVDEHTLFLLRNLIEFADPELNHLFPLCSEIMQLQKNPEIIFLAGLFHDIAKGRGGDHSELGAQEVRNFGQSHELPEAHTQIIEWLVANHLSMSLVAQKRDISDPNVIANFARLVGSERQLELLYILTVADIRATSNSLWNSWKDSLLRDLFLRTRQTLRSEESELNKAWQAKQTLAKQSLLESGYDESEIDNLWQQLDAQYFVKRSPEAIAWQTSKILSAEEDQIAVVGMRPTSRRSGSEIFVYTHDKENLFAALTATLARQGLSIQAANIYTNNNGYCFDSFFVLDDKSKAITEETLKARIIRQVTNSVVNIERASLEVQRRMPRQFKYFSIPTEVVFCDDEYSGYTRLELTTRDQPGLLAAVADAFKVTKIRLHDARINTLGEKVEDTFIISDRDNQPINNGEVRKNLARQIRQRLDN